MDLRRSEVRSGGGVRAKHSIKCTRREVLNYLQPRVTRLAFFFLFFFFNSLSIARLRASSDCIAVPFEELPAAMPAVSLSTKHANASPQFTIN